MEIPVRSPEDEMLARTFADLVFDRALETADKLKSSGVTDEETQKSLEDGLALKLGRAALEYAKNFGRKK